MKQAVRNDPIREVRRAGMWVVIAIVIWSVGWFTVHKLTEGRHHAMATHSGG